MMTSRWAIAASVLLAACLDQPNHGSTKHGVNVADANLLVEAEVGRGEHEVADVEDEQPLAVSVGPHGVMEAAELGAGYDERLAAHMLAERTRLSDPRPHFERLRAIAPADARVLLVAADRAAERRSNGDVVHDLAVVETILGASPGPRVTLIQHTQDGGVSTCGGFDPEIGQERAVFVTPAGEDGFRLIRIDDYYNGWFHRIAADQYAIDRGPMFSRADFTHLQGATP